MGQYTLTIREIVENNVDVFEGWDFPIFDEAYRAILKKKILDHYYFREIGVETVGKFIFNLRVRLNEIMPYFNKRYSAMALPQRILDNYDVTETYTRTTTDSSKKLFSDTPQGRTDLNTSEFVTEINDDSGTGSENWSRHIEGNYGVQTDARAIKEYLDFIVNVDHELLSALSDLFMLVY